MTQGQSHRFKGQGQTCSYDKNDVLNEWLDLDDIYTYDRCW